jgi:predicted MFS family arabinose efflux permease
VRRLLILASTIVFLDSAFYAAITPILPQLADEFGLGKTGAGILVAAYPAGTLTGALPGGLIAARLGVRPTVLIGLALMVVTSVAFAFGTSVVVLDVARFVQGLGSALSWAGAMGWLIGAAPADRRGEMIGSAMGAAIVGVLLGPLLGGAAHAFGRDVVFCGVAVAGVFMMAASIRIPGRRPTNLPRLRDLATAARDPKVALGMWLTTVPGLLFGTLQVLAPLRLSELGATATAIAACFLGAAALEAVVSPLSGRLSDRLGRSAPALFGLCAGVVTMLLIPWPESALALGALIVIGSPGIGALWAPAMAMLSDGTEEHGLEPAFGFALVNVAWAVGEGAGAAGSARLADAAGSDAVPYLLLAAICAGSAFLLVRSRRPSASLARQ